MNIELHGFESKQAEEIRQAVWSKLLANLKEEQWDECVVAVVPDHVTDRRGRRAPFFRVFSDKAADFKKITPFLKPIKMPGAGLRTIVECVLLKKCIEL
jgi:hypothetical protein